MNRFISLGEVRLGLRLIVKQPILSVTIILALATGICLATMGFTLRDELVNAKLPYPAGERFARLEAADRDGGRIDLDLERYHAFRDRATSFEHVGAFGARPFTLTHGAGEVESIRGAFITPRSMSWVEASPSLGRNLIPADGETGRRTGRGDPREPVAAPLSARIRQLIGRQLTIGGQPRTVVGIMPDTFEFPSAPASCGCRSKKRRSAAASRRSATAVRVFGVLRAGVTFERRPRKSNALSRQSHRRTPRVDEMRVRFRPFASEVGRRPNLVASALVGVLVMVLLVVASNVATLVFARTWSRAPELAVRTALGAPRTRVVGQLFLETLLLGSIAAVIGMAGAYASLRYIKDSLEGWPFWITLSPNPRIVAVRRRADAAGQRGERTAAGAARDEARSAQHAARRPRLRVRRFRQGRRALARRRDRVVGRAPERRRDDGARVQRVLRRDPGAAEESDPDRATRPHSIAGDARSRSSRPRANCRV